jgi:Ca2+-binding EF-hand superfamily protein
MKLIAAFLAVSLTAGLAGTASTAHADRGDRMQGRGGDPAVRIMDRFDTNRDGVLDRGEVTQMTVAMKQKRQEKGMAKRQKVFARAVARFDANRDGRLGPGEVPAELQRRMARFDLNGDGWVDAAEIAQPRGR